MEILLRQWTWRGKVKYEGVFERATYRAWQLMVIGDKLKREPRQLQGLKTRGHSKHDGAEMETLQKELVLVFVFF